VVLRTGRLKKRASHRTHKVLGARVSKERHVTFELKRIAGGNTRLTSFTPQRIHGREVNAVSTGASGTVCNSHSGLPRYTRAEFTSSREHTSREFPEKIPTVRASRRISDKLSLELSPTLHVFHIQFLGIRILQTPESRSQFHSFLRH
jgi:hypothetical protein